MAKQSVPRRFQQPRDEILAERAARLDKMHLKGWDAINEFSALMKEWDPRIVSECVRSISDWRDWALTDVQQQQQQQQQR